VADGAADHQRVRQRGLPVTARRARQPVAQQTADGGRQHHEEVLLPAAGVAEEAEGRAGVVGAVPVPEALDDRDRGVLGQAGEYPVLGQLVEQDDDGRDGQPRHCVGLGGGGLHQNHLLVSPLPSTLSTQRPQIVGCAATLPTSARCCQHLPHLGLAVRLASTRTSCAPSSATTLTSPLMKRNRSSSAIGASQFWSETPQRSAISASSAAPMVPAARIGSGTLPTCSRSAGRRRKSAAVRSAASASGARPSYHVVNNTLPSRVPCPASAGRWPHISSAVKLRIGAIHRTNASAMRYIALCAERRPGESPCIVYRRSLVTSR